MVNKNIQPEPIPVPVTYTIKKICDQCNGNGMVTIYPVKWIDDGGNPVSTTEEQCPQCAGDGKVAWGEMTTE